MCRWALMAMLVAAAPADARVIAPRDVAAAPADAAQVIAPRDVAAALAVAGDGRAFMVSPSARAGLRTRPRTACAGVSAPPGEVFGRRGALMPSSARSGWWMLPWRPMAAVCSWFRASVAGVACAWRRSAHWGRSGGR